MRSLRGHKYTIHVETKAELYRTILYRLFHRLLVIQAIKVVVYTAQGFDIRVFGFLSKQNGIWGYIGGGSLYPGGI